MLRKMREIHDTLTKHVSTTYLFQAFMRQIKNDRQNELTSHKAKMKLRRVDINPLINIYADGDSWFDYPLYKDTIEWIKEGAAKGVTVMDMAHYGDASIDTLGVHKRERMKALWSDPENGHFDAILVSMGGNDICGEQFIMWISQNTGQGALNAITEARFTDMMYVIESAYSDLIALRDQCLPNAYVFIHGYDYVQPTGLGVCGVGPWLKPSLDYLGWTDPADAKTICKMALDAFGLLMEYVAANNKNVIYVKTAGTLNADHDWGNELHPTEHGFKKIADKFLMKLREVFPGRV